MSLFTSFTRLATPHRADGTLKSFPRNITSPSTTIPHRADGTLKSFPRNITSPSTTIPHRADGTLKSFPRNITPPSTTTPHRADGTLKTIPRNITSHPTLSPQINITDALKTALQIQLAMLQAARDVVGGTIRVIKPLLPSAPTISYPSLPHFTVPDFSSPLRALGGKINGAVKQISLPSSLPTIPYPTLPHFNFTVPDFSSSLRTLGGRVNGAAQQISLPSSLPTLPKFTIPLPSSIFPLRTLKNPFGKVTSFFQAPHTLYYTPPTSSHLTPSTSPFSTPSDSPHSTPSDSPHLTPSTSPFSTPSDSSNSTPSTSPLSTSTENIPEIDLDFGDNGVGTSSSASSEPTNSTPPVRENQQTPEVQKIVNKIENLNIADSIKELQASIKACKDEEGQFRLVRQKADEAKGLHNNENSINAGFSLPNHIVNRDETISFEEGIGILHKLLEDQNIQLSEIPELEKYGAIYNPEGGFWELFNDIVQAEQERIAISKKAVLKAHQLKLDKLTPQLSTMSYPDLTDYQIYKTQIEELQRQINGRLATS